MTAAMEILKNRFTELLGWERRKRREQTLIAAACAAFALALIFLPLHVYLPADGLRWWVPVALFMALAPWFFHRARWRRADSVRALAQVDKTLNLDERAVTAWELSAKPEPGAAAALVLQQAEARLRGIDPRALLPRRWRWPAYVAAPLCALWLTMLWFDFDRQSFDAAHSAPQTLAHKLREFSRELQDKAKNEGLRETLKLGRELEKTAQKNIDAKSADESLKKELAAVAKKFAAPAAPNKDNDSLSGSEGEQSLKDLKAELEASKDLLEAPEVAKGMDELGRRWMERLEALPQLKRQFDKAEHGGQNLSQNDLRSFLDKLDQQVNQELDRRAVLDAQRYLEQMMKQGGGEKGENYARSGAGDTDPTADGAREKNLSNLPGKEPGKRDDDYRSLPELRPGASTQVKGMIGEGESSALMFKGKPTAGKSAVSEAEIVASYRRQAEQELNSERVPEGLKETIKNYFMSLGEAKK